VGEEHHQAGSKSTKKREERKTPGDGCTPRGKRIKQKKILGFDNAFPR
jgi:hypothetical protein